MIKNTPKKYNITALVPAHNEEENIAHTLISLVEQTYSLERIIVICDNCTDKTELIAHEMSLRYACIEVVKTVNNTAKKAGALNYGYSLIDKETDLIAQMDADSILTRNLVEMGVREFAHDPNVGGVCGRFFPALPVGRLSWLGTLMWQLQNIEYGMADAERVSMISEDARVLSGTFSMYRKYVLDKVATSYTLSNGVKQVWVEKSLVEDFTLTMDVRAKGFKTKCSHNMTLLTHIPRTFMEYWKQRERWYGGTIDELRSRGLTHYTIVDILTHIFGIFMMMSRILFYALLVFLLITHAGVEFNPLTIFMPILIFMYNGYRYKYIRLHRNWTQALMVFTLVPLELYAILREILMVRSYYLSFFKKNRTW